MRITHLFVPAIAATLILSACGGSPPPPMSPSGPTQAEIDARNDSIAAARAAEEMRTDAERAAQRREQERMNRARDQARATLEAVVRFDYDESVITAAAERLLRAKLPILRNSPRSASALRGTPTSGARRSTTSHWEAGVPRVCGTFSRASGFRRIASPRPRSGRSALLSTVWTSRPGLRTDGSSS